MNDEKKAKLIRLLSAEHILEDTEIFKNIPGDELSDSLDARTVRVIKRRFAAWHKTWVEKQLVEILQESNLNHK